VTEFKADDNPMFQRGARGQAQVADPPVLHPTGAARRLAKEHEVLSGRERGQTGMALS